MGFGAMQIFFLDYRYIAKNFDVVGDVLSHQWRLSKLWHYGSY